MRLVGIALVAGCVVRLPLQAPPPNASVAERRSAYRWNRIAEVTGPGRGGHAQRAVLGTGELAHGDELRPLVSPNGITAGALDRYDADEARALRWMGVFELAIVSTIAADVAEGLELQHPAPWIVGTSLLALAIVGLCISRVTDLGADANDELAIAYSHYNRELRETLHLCDRDYMLVDCGP